MRLVDKSRARSGLLIALLTIGVSLVLAEPLSAQGRGGGPRSGGGSRAKKPPSGQKPKVDEPDWVDTGSDKCHILKFEPTTDPADETLVGYLSVKPMGKKAKTLKLAVRKTDKLQIEVGTQAIELDALGGLEWKGLTCTASWIHGSSQPPANTGEKPKKKTKGRELTSLSIDTLDLEGTIESIEGDSILIKAKPMRDGDWPAPAGKDSSDPKAAKKVALRKLKLKIVDEFTKFEGSGGTLELGDFQVGQDIEATAVCGGKSGLMVALKAPGLEGKKPEGPAPKQGPTQPPPTRNPRGNKGGGGPRI
jgi:hypothetical protein